MPLNTKGWRRVGTATAALTLALCMGCANAPPGQTVYDPYEGLNRKLHAVNKSIDRYAVRPASEAYAAATPGLIRLLVSNALNHLELPRDFANNLLSGRWKPAGTTLARFGVNTIVGAGGLLDPATDFGLMKQPADFGQTLARWGVSEGFYYEIPALGPTVARHTVGRVVDLAFAPTSYVVSPFIGLAVSAEQAVRVLELRADNASAFDNVLYDSPDSYVTAQTLYLQSRRAALAPPSAVGEDDLELIPE